MKLSNNLDCVKKIPKVHALGHNINLSDVSKRNPLEATTKIKPSAIKPHYISYVRPIQKINHQIKTMGINPFLLFDGSEKNLIIAQKIQKCLTQIQEKKLEIPKFELHFDNWKEAFEGGKLDAAATDVYEEAHGKLNIDMLFNTPSYKYISASGDLFRLKENPEYTSLEMDFFHEFAHAWMARNDNENYEKLMAAHFDEETKKEIMEKVTDYAIRNKAEFIAEYFSMKMMGKEIKSEKLSKLYEEFKGPKID